MASVAKNRKKARRWLLGIASVLFVLFLAGIWRHSPLHEYAKPEVLSKLFEDVRVHWWTPLLIIPSYILAHFILFPNMALNASIILAFGGVFGWLFAILGSLSSASFFFFLGRRFGAEQLEHWIGDRISRIRRLLRRGGVGAVISVRLVPIAPYPIVNTAAGAIHIRYRDFFFGTFLGHLPGTMTLTFFGEQLAAYISNPNIRNLLILAVILAIGGLLIWLFRWYARRRLEKDILNSSNEIDI